MVDGYFHGVRLGRLFGWFVVALCGGLQNILVVIRLFDSLLEILTQVLKLGLDGLLLFDKLLNTW